MKNLIRLLSLSLLLLFLATSCDMLDEIIGDGGDYGDLRVYNLVVHYQNGSVNLSWENVEGADSYDIWFSEDEYNNYDHVDTVYGNSYTHNYGFQSERYYYYKIRIMDYSGNWHEYSDPVYVFIEYNNGGSDTVENLYVYMDGNSAAISWNQHHNAQEYELEYKEGEYGNYMYLATLDEWTTSFYHYDLNSSTYYYYRIRYRDFNGNWSNYSDEVWVYSGDDHGGGDLRVYNLYADYYDGSVTLSWEYIDGANSYEIWFSQDEFGTYQHIDTVYGSTSYTHNYGFQSDTYYYYKVRVVDYDYVYHDFSDPEYVYVNFNGGGNTINNFYVEMSGNSTYLYWSQHIDAQQYEIEYSYYEYDSYMHLVTIYNNYTTEYYHDYVDSNTYYYYRIRFLDYNGYWSDYSDPIWIYTGGSNTVNNLNAEMYGSSSYIYWDEHYDAVEYQLEYSNYEYGSYMLIATLNSYTTEFFHDNLNPYSDYYYRIRYQNTYLEWSEYTDPVYVYSGDLIGEGVTGFNAYVDNGLVHLNWDYHYDADYYEIWGADNYGGEYVHLGNSSNTDFTDDTVSPNSERYYKVRLINYNGDPGAYSVIIYVYVEVLLSDNNYLSSLVVSDGTLDFPFDQNDTYYLLTVGSEVDVITVTPTLEDNTATLHINDAEFYSGEVSGPVSIVMGDNDNVFVIDVYAENGTAKTYYIDVFREPNADIKDFIVHGAVNIDYDEFEDSYYVGLETGVSSVDIEVITLDPTAVITIEGVVTSNKTINLSGDYNVRTFTMEIDPNDGLGDSRFIDVYIVPSWTNDNPGGESALYYSFPSTLFDEYMVQWDDKVNGSGRYYEDILVTALYEDNSTVYGDLNRVNSGFHSPETLTADEDGIIILKVEAVDGGILEDEFALRVYNITTDTWVPFIISGDNTIVIE